MNGILPMLVGAAFMVVAPAALVAKGSLLKALGSRYGRFSGLSTIFFVAWVGILLLPAKALFQIVDFGALEHDRALTYISVAFVVAYWVRLLWSYILQSRLVNDIRLSQLILEDRYLFEKTDSTVNRLMID